MAEGHERTIAEHVKEWVSRDGNKSRDRSGSRDGNRSHDGNEWLLSETNGRRSCYNTRTQLTTTNVTATHDFQIFSSHTNAHVTV